MKRQTNFKLHEKRINQLDRFAKQLDCNRTQALEYILDMLLQCRFERKTWMKTDLVHIPTGRVIDFHVGEYGKEQDK